MNCSPIITAEDFKTIHNALCELRSLQERLTGVISDTIADRLQGVVKDFERGLESAYEQDRAAFDARYNHFERIRDELGLRAIWSLFEVDNLSDRHPFEGADRVVYENHWGAKPVQCSINGLTWAALYVAANACIRDSGDDHHIYIESFVPSEDDPRTLLLHCGS